MSLTDKANKIQKSQQEIQNWLVSALAKLLAVDVHKIDIHEPLAYYGLESVEVITISGELSDWLGYTLPPTLIWDYPTVAEVAEYIANHLEV